MITIQLGTRMRASIEQGKWASDRPRLQRILQQATEAMDVPEWVVDPDQYVVGRLYRVLPIKFVRQ